VRYFPILLGAGVLVAGYQLAATSAVEWRPGTLVESAPQQAELAPSTPPVALEGFELTPRASFRAEVRVLGRSRYWLGDFADVSPLDIAVGWGPMSDSAVLTRIDVSQSGRFYFWRYEDEPPIPRADIESHSANWHLIPANDAVWKKLRGLRVGDIVTLDGRLVDASHPQAGTLRTSLRRDDTGAGACEIVLVETVSVRHR
jgi:hypothetical protein